MPDAEIVSFLNSAVFKNINCSDLKQSRYFLEMAKLYNYEPIILRFISEEPETFARCIHWSEDIDNVTRILANKAVKALITNESLCFHQAPLAELTDGWNINWDNFDKLIFEYLNPLYFDSELAELVCNGGLFEKWIYSAAEAKTWATVFVNEIIQGRFDDFKIYQLEEGWSGWFGGMYEDLSFFIFDEGRGEFWILAMTDSD